MTRSSILRRLVAASTLALTAGAVATSTPAVAAGPVLVINEIDYDQPGTDAAEFVEIKNTGDAPADLTTAQLVFVNGNGTAIYDTIDLQGTLAAGDYYVVCANAATVANCDLDDGPDTNFIQNGAPDAVALRVDGTLVDTVSYEGDTGAPYTEGSGVGLVDDASSATDGISRCADGSDTNQNAVDFTVAAITPGAKNACGESPIVINEFSANHTGADTVEYVEVYAAPGTDLSAYTVLEIEGDSNSSMGVIDEVISLGTTDASGLHLVDLPANALENGTISLLLVENFTGALSADLDTNDDGTLDVTPWSAVVDGVAVSDGGAGDRTYAVPVLAANYDGFPFGPGGASRIPDGTDTDSAADWVRNDFDLAGIPGFTGTITAGEAYNTPGASNEAYTTPPPPPEACGDEFTAIYAIQGSGSASPLAGTEVATEGVVVGDFQNNASVDSGNLNGFHIQDPSGDGDAATSDGIFVFAPGGIDVAAGDAVRVRGNVSEFNGMTEITAAQIWVCSSGNSITPATLTLPVTSLADLEAFEGMSVTFPQSLVISEYFNFDRFGEIVLTSERHLTPTAEFEPGADAVQAAAEFLLDRITLDDGRTNQNPDPAIHPNGGTFDLTNLFRGGDTVTGVTGVLDYSFGQYRIQPTQGAEHTNANPRTVAPDDVGGDVTVASFNVLNYFTTLDDAGPICGPAANQDCRGADNATELGRQRAKIIAALTAIDADVVGLIEIENHPGDVPTADLVAGLNDAMGAGTYDYVETGAIGTDAIRVAIVYKPAAVAPSGDFAVLDSSVDPRFVDGSNRPVLAQTFVENGTGATFTVAVNHLKSKGSNCNGLGDPDLGDGAGNCNLTRKAAAEALVDWLAGDPTGSGDGDVLIVGDLNSYDKEDPIDAILAGSDDTAGTGDDYTDLVRQFLGEAAYSYVFDGQTGYLDHALASATLTSQVSGTTIWHINADEPDLIDYDTSFKLPAQDAIYAPDPYRSSDHDPVIVGLDLNAPPVCTAASASIDTLLTPNHKMVAVDVLGVVDPEGEAVTITIDSVFQDEPVDGDDDGNTAPDATGVGTSTASVRAERSGVGDGRVYHIGFTATDATGNSCSGEVLVSVPLSRNGAAAVDGGALFDATVV